MTTHGRPASVLIGFDSEEDWFDYRLEHHPEFLTRIAAARAALAQGRGVPIEALDDRTFRESVILGFNLTVPRHLSPVGRRPTEVASGKEAMR